MPTFMFHDFSKVPVKSTPLPFSILLSPPPNSACISANMPKRVPAPRLR